MLTQEQFDNLVLVIYNDVNEWYSVNSPFEDDPGRSFMFILTSLLRSVRTPRAGRAKVIRKQVQQPIRLFVNGQYYSGTVQSIGIDGMTLTVSEVVAATLYDLRVHYVPLIGLEMVTPTMTHRLIGKVDQVTVLSGEVEISFPAQLEKQQSSKITQAFSDISQQQFFITNP
jgi:cellulose synthase (UDP-forming)